MRSFDVLVRVSVCRCVCLRSYLFPRYTVPELSAGEAENICLLSFLSAARGD